MPRETIGRDTDPKKIAAVFAGLAAIDREPEATVAALRALEPDTTGLDQLLDAFDSMVDRQLAHPKEVLGGCRYKERKRTMLNIPRGNG